MSNKYEEAGVSLDAGYESIERIKKHVKSTNILGVMSSLGSFGSMFDLSVYDFKKPVLISGCDGVGTKIKICEMFENYSYIGEDLVAMSVNDILVQGALPLYFLDYIACGKNDPRQIEEIVKSIANGCKISNCALIGGETAEMPDVYEPGSYDLAGFVVGCQEKDQIVTGKDVQVGDVIIGLPSNGLHANGFSLVRKILLKDNKVNLQEPLEELGNITLEEELLKPTRIYYNEVCKVQNKYKINAMAHITGGGYEENITRALNGFGANISILDIPILPIFNYLAKLGNIPINEMFNYFNMGIGYVFIINKEDQDSFLKDLPESLVIGHVTKQKEVKLCD